MGIKEKKESQFIDVKQAVQIVSEYLKDLMPDVRDIFFEEFELTDDEQFWIITLSYIIKDSFIENLRERYIKEFTVRRNDRKVMAMKLRKI